jgi:hypothetical protein
MKFTDTFYFKVIRNSLIFACYYFAVNFMFYISFSFAELKPMIGFTLLYFMTEMVHHYRVTTKQVKIKVKTMVF